MTNEELIARLEARLLQLRKAEANANFGGCGLAIRVSDPDALIEDYVDAIAALRAKESE
jgi:hypothetical protein